MAEDHSAPPRDPAQAGEGAAAAEAGGVAAGAALLNMARLREFATLLIVIAVVIVFHIKTLPQTQSDPFPSVFLSPNNIQAMLRGITTEAILVVGMTVVIVGGAFDISVGSILALSGLACVFALKCGLPTPVGVIIGLLTGSLCGLINGLFVARVGISPLIATMGMMMVARGLVICYIHAAGPVRSDDLPSSFAAIGRAGFFGVRPAGEPGFLNMQGFWVMVITLATVVIGDVLLRNLRWLRQVYYMGGNEKAAALSGINVARVRTVTFVITGLTAGLAGVLNSARYGTASYEAGQGIELQVIAECVIGGASLVGGQGTVLGAFLGVVLVNCIKTGLTQTGVPPDWRFVIVGAALVFFVTLDVLVAKRRRGA